MNSWSELNNEYNQAVITGGSEKSGYNHILQRKSQMINDLSTLTGRNTILYFSAFLNHGKNSINTDINDKDVNALMETVKGTNKRLGLDLILHTPGGEIGATEQIISYLKSYYGDDIRAIVPQMAMSAGSMIAVSCKSILMGRQSCIGPFDPQLGGVACQSMLREYEYAVKEVTNNPASLGLWQVMFSKLTPTFLTRCQQADELVDKLTDKILSGKGLSAAKVRNIKKKFAKNDDTKAHNRHIDREECRKVGLLIEDLESRQDIQDLVLGIHHCCMILADKTNLDKIVENNIGGNYILATAIPPTNP
jgi:ClpP class serine protease